MPLAQDTAPRYLLHGRLGSGGMGVVHLGTLLSSAGQRRVAIKRLTGHGAVDQIARERLIAEARLVFQLTHANICQVLDLSKGDGGTFIVMEYIQGLDLRALLRRLMADGKKLDVASAVHIARDVARGLDYAHRRTDDEGRPLGVVHGDVTPQNVLLSIEGEIKLTDFGIARALGTGGPGGELCGGTPGYFAPEAAHGISDHRADLYSLGVTLFVALTGESPREQGFDPSPLRSRTDVPQEIYSIIERLTAMRPEARFLSAGEVERVLSLELARRYPAFIPSMLGELVRIHMSSGPEEPSEEGSMLFSMTYTTAADPYPPGTPGKSRTSRTPRLGTPSVRVPSAQMRLHQTQTVLPLPRRGGLARTVALALVGAMIIATAGLVFRLRATRTPVASASETPDRLPGELSSPEVALPAPAPTPHTAPPGPPVELSLDPPKPVANQVRSARPPPGRAPATRISERGVAGPPGFLTINSAPWGQVFIDGHRVADETPLYRHPLSAGEHKVMVYYPDRKKYSRPQRIKVVSGELRTLGFHP